MTVITAPLPEQTKLYWRVEQPGKWVAAYGTQGRSSYGRPLPRYKYLLTVWQSGRVWMARTAHANGRRISSAGQFATQRQAQDWAAREVGLNAPQHVTGRVPCQAQR